MHIKIPFLIVLERELMKDTVKRVIF